MTKFLISPAERPPITNLGTNSPLPEKVGCDILWSGVAGLAGCQRKAMCLDPLTRVLTADLRWIPIQKVQLGDFLMGFDDEVPGPHGRRQWKQTQVVAVTPVTLPAYELVFDDETTIVCSGEHRWLTYRSKGAYWTRTDHLQPKETFPNKTSRIVRLTETWEELRDWEAGYLAGAFDGEGHLQQRPSRGNGHAMHLTISQTRNAMLPEIFKYLDHHGFTYHHHNNKRAKEHWSPTVTIRVSPRSQALRFLGSVRPSRILGQFKPDMIGQVYAKPKPLSVQLLSRREVGPCELIGLTTTTGTFVAEGLASHNSDLISSVHDNRLGREVEQMAKADLRYRFLVIEGQPSWDREGNLAGSRSRWSIRQHNGVLLSVQQQGIQVVSSRTALETCAIIEHLYDWTQKKDHVSSLLARDKAPRNGWGKTDERSTFVHFFSAVDGVSNEMSGRIYDALGNILALTVGEAELKTVKGLGPTRIASIMKTFAPVQQSGTVTE